MPDEKKTIAVQELIDLLDVAKLVVSTLEMDQVLEAILKSAMKLTETSAGSIALYHKDTRELELRAHMGFSEDFIGDRKWTVRPDGLTSEILKSKNPTVITDTANREFFTNPLAIKEGIKSVVCVPLFIEDDIIGILYVDDFSPRKFTESELGLLSILSSFAAMSIDHAKLHEMTSRMALTDSLTGLANVRCFHIELEKQIGRATRFKETFSLMMFDIDDFKKHNDDYGHVFGDQVLKWLGEVLKAASRVSDIAARYGGEEFVIILPMSDSSQGMILAQRIMEMIKKRSADLMQDKRPLTVSIGISTYPGDAMTGQELIQKADQALYEAKRRGKDQAVEYRTIKTA
jgi:diguanylate cyclase (GGDEF)-like protein